MSAIFMINLMNEHGFRCLAKRDAKVKRTEEGGRGDRDGEHM